MRKNIPIVSSSGLYRTETFSCVDNREKIAKVIICEGYGQVSDKTLGVINVPLLGDARFGDDIFIEARINSNIVLKVTAYSKMVKGYKTPEDQYSKKQIIRD